MLIATDNELVRTDTGHDEHIEKRTHLQPESSCDSSDPLNFSLWRKTAILLLMSLYAFISTGSSAILGSTYPVLTTAFATFDRSGQSTGIVPFSDLTQLTAVNNVMLGAANIWRVPLGNVYGRRPIILVNLALLAGFSFWCGKAETFHSLIVARVLQGIGGAAADTLAPDVVGRVFFLHQRGRAMAIYTIFLASGSLVGGLVGGYVTSSLSWRWTMFLPGIASVILFIMTFLLMPKTLFDRTRALEHAADSRSNSELGADKRPNERSEHIETVQVRHTRTYKSSSSVQCMSFMQPRPGLLKQFLVPYLTLRLPGTLMVMLHYAGLVGLTVTISVVAPNILAAPPCLWGASVGLINIGGLVGTVLGAAYTYLTTDWLVKRIAKKETRGRTEPKDRLVLMWPAIFMATGGAIVFGLCARASVGSKGWTGIEFGTVQHSFFYAHVNSYVLTFRRAWLRSA